MKFNWKYYIVTTLILVTGILALLSLIAFSQKTNTLFGKAVYYDNNVSVSKLEYSRTNVTFYEENEEFLVDLNLESFENFDGNDKNYKVELNNFAFFSKIHDGVIEFDIVNKFKNADGILLVKDTLKVRIEFLNTGTKFCMKTTSADGVNCWQSLFNVEGFRLLVEEVV